VVRRGSRQKPALLFLSGRLTGTRRAAMTDGGTAVGGALFAALMSSHRDRPPQGRKEETGRLERSDRLRVGSQARSPAAIMRRGLGPNVILNVCVHLWSGSGIPDAWIVLELALQSAPAGWAFAGRWRGSVAAHRWRTGRQAGGDRVARGRVPRRAVGDSDRGKGGKLASPAKPC